MVGLEKIKQYVSSLFDEKLDPNYTYHDIDHTLMVFDSVTDIAKKSNIDGNDLLILQVAALFHDSGFIYGAKDHEKNSINLTKSYLTRAGYEPQFIDKVCECIAATQIGANTTDTLALILQDADMSGLGNINHSVITERLRKELNNTSDKKFSKKEWRSINADFITKSSYNTAAARELYDDQKAKNYKNIQTRKSKSKKNTSVKSLAQNKSAQTQFKTALRNHIDLSNIADNKANIMISVNALILTLALPFLIDKAMDNHFFWFPTALLACVCLISMIFATLATRPIKLKGITTETEIKSNASNLFFFGNYYKMQYENYKDGVHHILNNSDALDDSIIRDLFFLGKSLGRKFSNLRLCYNIFMYGITLTVFALMIVYFS